MPDAPTSSPLDLDATTMDVVGLLRSYVLARLRTPTPEQGATLMRVIVRASREIARAAGVSLEAMGDAAIAGLADPPPPKESLITPIPVISPSVWPMDDVRCAAVVAINARAIEVIQRFGLTRGPGAGRLIVEAMGAGALLFADLTGIPDAEALGVLTQGFHDGRASLNDRPKKGLPS